MKTMTRVSATGDAQVRASQETGAGFDYEGIRLDGPEEKLIPPADAILFYCRVARLQTRPVRITEAEGCVTVRWSCYAPHVFRDCVLKLVAAGELIDTLTLSAA